MTSRNEDPLKSRPSAMAVAVKFLSRTERFEGEVRQKLAEYDETEVDTTIAALKRQNIINDSRTLGSFCQSHQGRKAIGAYQLELELKRKGVSEELIAEACNREGEDVRALGVLAGKFKPQAELKPKGFRFLVGRGFSYEIAHIAVRDFFVEERIED